MTAGFVTWLHFENIERPLKKYCDNKDAVFVEHFSTNYMFMDPFVKSYHL